jgi:flagellar motor switch protein FliM
MGDVLSQDEINAILVKISATGGNKTNPDTAENRPDKFSREQIRAISTIHNKFALLASKSLSERLRSTVKMSAASVDQLYMGEFFRTIPVPSTLGVISMEPLKSGAVLEIDPAITVAIINKTCDNNDESTAQWHEATGIGKKIMEDTYSLLLENLREAWSGVTDLRPKLEKIEHDPQFIKIVPSAEWVLLVTFGTKIEDATMKTLSAEGMLNLCIPYPVIMPF